MEFSIESLEKVVTNNFKEYKNLGMSDLQIVSRIFSEYEEIMECNMDYKKTVYETLHCLID